MNWMCLWNAFLQGESGAVQAFFNIVYTIVTAIGTWFIAASFRNQNLINREQREINRLAMEDNKRKIRPVFVINDIRLDAGDNLFYELKLTNAIALHVRLINIKSGDNNMINELSYWNLEKPPIDYKIESNSSNLERNSILLLFSEDEVGRKYKQEVYTKNRGVFISFPLLLDPNFTFPK